MEALQELLTEQLRDLYDAEKQLTKALPKLAKAASNAELKQAFTEHVEVTRNQVARLEEIFEMLGEKAKGKPCKAMKGLIEEGQEHISEEDKGPKLDCALVASCLRVEHYETAGYLSARSTAKIGGQRDVVNLLAETQKEEEQTGKLLLQIGERLQKELMQAGGEEEEEEDGSGGGRGRGRKGAKKAASKSAGAKSGSGTSGMSGGSKGRGGKGNGGGSGSGGNGSGGNGSGGTIITTDHDEIREWAEARGAKPAAVAGTGKKGQTGLLRLDFPGYSGGGSLEEISWEEFFEKFDEQGLALLHQETTAGGQQSNFNKLISRETAAEASGGRGGGSKQGRGGAKKSGGKKAAKKGGR